jgi:hypothetical protein
MTTDTVQENVSNKMGSSIQTRQPQEKPVTEDSLMSFAQEVGLSSTHMEKIQVVADKVIAAIKAKVAKCRVGVSESRHLRNDKDESSVQVVVYVPQSGQEQEGTSEAKTNEAPAKEASEAPAPQQEQQQASGFDRVEGKTYDEINEVCSSLSVQNMTQDKQGIHFELDNVKFDVTVAADLGKDKGMRRQAVWRQIQTRDKDGKLHKEELEKFSMSLNDSMDEVLQPTDDFEKDAFRLARAWRQAALPHVGAFSPLDSLLVMDNSLSRRRRRGTRDSMVNVMRDFFNELEDIENMNLTFPNFYERSVVPQWVLDERPLLLDPVLPWHNTLRGISRSSLADIATQARQALSLLDSQSPSLHTLFGPYSRVRSA